jgi:hypothetical protein
VKRAITIYYDDDAIELVKVDISPQIEARIRVYGASWDQAIRDFLIWISGVKP